MRDTAISSAVNFILKFNLDNLFQQPHMTVYSNCLESDTLLDNLWQNCPVHKHNNKMACQEGGYLCHARPDPPLSCGRLVSYPDYFSPSGKIVWWTAYTFWFNYFEITVMPCQLHCEFKNALVNSKVRDSLLVLLSKMEKPSLYAAPRVAQWISILLVHCWYKLWNAIFNDIKC